MRCMFINHDWSHWHPTKSASDRTQIKICKKCGKITNSEIVHGISFVPLKDLENLTLKYFNNSLTAISEKG